MKCPTVARTRKYYLLLHPTAAAGAHLGHVNKWTTPALSSRPTARNPSWGESLHLDYSLRNPPFAKSSSALAAMSLVLSYQHTNGERQLKAGAAD
eukprot:15379-Heterococcus_DN1.PRE.2